MAVCPFCRKHICINEKIVKYINASCHRDVLSSVLSGKANLVKCSECNEQFYYEHNFGVFNVVKNYAVMCVPGGAKNIIPAEKTALYKILGLDDFKLRYVSEFINLIEKVRIFEFNLDDRVLEIIKYKYVVIPSGIDIFSKVILTNTESNAMVFTVFDNFDKAIAVHRVSIDAYSKESAFIEKELMTGAEIKWKNINIAWAEKVINKQ